MVYSTTEQPFTKRHGKKEKEMNANDYASILENQGHKYIADFVRQQQAEIEFLKKEILEKHEDWKHEGQQAANARAEIEVLKAKLIKYYLKEALDRNLNLIYGKEFIK